MSRYRILQSGFGFIVQEKFLFFWLWAPTSRWVGSSGTVYYDKEEFKTLEKAKSAIERLKTYKVMYEEPKRVVQ